MMRKLYNFVTSVASPVVRIHLARRREDGKESEERFSERFGYAGQKRKNGHYIWFHAASVGESLSILPLIDKISGYNILITTGTVSSAKLLSGGNYQHQFVPVDLKPCVERFLQYWQPSLAIFVESELWPHLIFETKKYCPLILANASISEKSLNNWMRFPGLKEFALDMLAQFSEILVQSRKDVERFKILGQMQVEYFGNIKMAAAPLSYSPQELDRLKNMSTGRKIVLAASTHHDEEEQLAEIYQNLKKEVDNLLFIIVPRHPSRGKKIAELLQAKGLNIALRSQDDEINPQIDIYLANTIGELGIFYRMTDIAFIGGSLIKHGGQNPLEAARLDTAIIIGPNVESFEEIIEDMEKAHAIIKVSNHGELQNKLKYMIADETIIHQYQQNAREFANMQNHMSDKLLKKINDYLEVEKSD